jgi:hypothetical protein
MMRGRYKLPTVCSWYAHAYFVDAHRKPYLRMQAQKYGIGHFFETSAKSGANIEVLLCNAILSASLRDRENIRDSITLTNSYKGEPRPSVHKLPSLSHAHSQGAQAVGGYSTPVARRGQTWYSRLCRR